MKFLAAATIIITCNTMITTSTPANPVYVTQPPIAKPNCPQRCGNVIIPFPFGIGPNCSADDKWFEIVCINNTNTSTKTNPTSSSTNSKPFLKRIPQVEVLRIFTENSTLRAAQSAIWFSNCPDKVEGPSIKTLDLRGSPFSFSDSRNRLTAVGCNYFWYLDVGSDLNTLRAAGCAGFCPNSTDQNINSSSSSASTKGKLNNDTVYCQTIIPSYLNSFNISFDRMTNDNSCTYAFVADQEWLSSRLRSDLEGIRKKGSVPVVLNWDLLDYNENLELNQSFSRQCHQEDATSSIEGLRYQCFCHNGYGGNPYLHGGCKGNILVHL